jgi:GNAT superfamily N-acetyltransferase
MIDYPVRDEIEALVALARDTDFFRPLETDIVREMLIDFLDHAEAVGPAGYESGEYVWIVYREEPDGPALGFACYGEYDMGENVWELYWIAVDRRYQNRRVGSALLKHVEEHVAREQARHLYIETSDTEQYAPTRAFYLRRGYDEAAHLPDYYRPGDGKVVYRRIFR